MNRLIAGLLWGGVAFAPWAFGGTQRWSIMALNISGTLLGLFWLLTRDSTRESRHWTSMLLAWSTVSILIYSLVAALNAQSAFGSATGAFRPLPHLSWLPHSYDRSASWLALWQNLSLAGTFWAARAWLLRGVPKSLPSHTGLLPRQARCFLIFIVTNGFLISVVALLQRLDNTDKLLWLVRPTVNHSAAEQFGPFAYRGNGLQYIALIWPAAMALWSMFSDAQLHESLIGTGRRGGMLLCGLTMAACPFLWQSRLAVAVDAAAILIVAYIVLGSHRVPQRRLMVAAGIALAVGIGLALNWRGLSERFARAGLQSGARLDLLQAGLAMFRDNWLFGIGPGAFPSLHALYRPDSGSPWLAQMHCDWLQTLATYGSLGFVMWAAAWAALFFSPRQPGKLPVRTNFLQLAGVGLLACLADALLDFPFQVYSIEHLCVVLAAFFSACTHSRSSPAAAPSC